MKDERTPQSEHCTPSATGDAPPRCVIHLHLADGRRRPFPVAADKIVIGRDSRCDLHLSLPQVGLRHCELARRNDAWSIRHLDKGTATLHNDCAIDDETPVRTGDRFTIGPVMMEIELGDELSTSSDAAAVEIVVNPAANQSRAAQ